MPDRLQQSIDESKASLRELARVLGRAKLHPDDQPNDVVDLLLSAGFPEETADDTALLDVIDPENADED